MHEQKFADYFKDVAAKFGFTGVHYDADKHAVVFPSASTGSDQLPEAFRDQPATFFAFLAGSLAVGTKHTVLQSSDEGALLQIKGSESYLGEHLMSHRDAKLKKIDDVNSHPDAAETHRALIEDYNDYMAKIGYAKPVHLPQDHAARSPADYASGRTSSKADIGPNAAQD